ncbi:MAG: pentapeptide repeat-containing protein [Acidimicrobiia bacterium]|nr:pentapeptide repeat-containing protein [Acidimicrobiia bacterium]
MSLPAAYSTRSPRTGCKLEEADFNSAILIDVTFEGSELRLVDLVGASFERVDLRRSGSGTRLRVGAGRRRFDRTVLSGEKSERPRPR